MPPIVLIPWLPDTFSVQKAFVLRFFLILACAAVALSKRTEKILDPVFAVLLVLNIGWLLTANTFSNITPEGRLELNDLVLTFIAMAVAARLAPKDSDLRRALIACAAVLWIVSLWGFFNRYLPRSLAPFPREEIAGMFSHPNVFAQYAAPIIPICVGLALASANRSQLFFALLAFVTVMIPFLLAYSRGAILAAAAGSALLLAAVTISAQNKKRIWTSGAALGVAALISLAIFWGFDQPGKKRGRVLEEVAEISDIKSSSFKGRLALWRQGMETARDYPVFGCGAGKMRGCLSARRRPEDPEGKFMHKDVHQDYIQLAAQFGVPALILYLALMARLLWLGVKTVRRLAPDDPQRIYRLALMAGALVFFLHGLVSFPLSRSVPRLYAFCFLGFAAAPMIAFENDWGQRKNSPWKSAIFSAIIFTFLGSMLYTGVVMEGRSIYGFWKVRKFFEDNKFEEASKACETILDDRQSGLSRKVRCLSLIGRRREKEKLLIDLSNLAENYPGHYGIALMRATALAASGKTASACREAERGAALWPRSPRWKKFVQYAVENADGDGRAVCVAVRKRLKSQAGH